MLNYFNVYKNFVNSKKKTGITAKEARARGYEHHHIIPKSRGGQGFENYAWLSEFDHCIAHILLNIALMQQHELPLNYVIRKCISRADQNLIKYYNPLSKVKVVALSECNDSKVMTLLEAAEYWFELMHHARFRRQKAKNNAIVNVLRMICNGNGNGNTYQGIRFKFHIEK